MEGSSPELRCDKPDSMGGVALSGGRDSVLLLEALVRRDGPSTWVALHVDHGVRSEESRELEKKIVDRVCSSLDVVLRRCELPTGHPSSEEALRESRYRVLGEMSSDLDWVVLGHHVHDQVETILMKLLRGCDLGALEGMPEKFERGGQTFLRPMLHWSESELAAMREELKAPFFEDPTNAEPKYLRNRIRAELLPLLESISPGWVGRVAGLGESARIWKGGLDSRLEELFLAHPWEEVGEDHYKAPRMWLQELDPYLLKAWTRHQLEWVCGRAGAITRQHVDSFADFASSEELGHHHLNFPGGWRLRGQKRWLHLLK